MSPYPNFSKAPGRTAGILGAHRTSPRPIAVAVLVALLVACADARPAPTPSARQDSPPQALHLPRVPPLQPIAPSPPGIRTLARFSVAAVGDVLMHGAVKDSAADHRVPGNDDGFGWLWSPVADLLSSADLAFANLETPIAPRTGLGARSFVFNAPPSTVRALRRAGVSLVSVANNHMFDQGRPGFEETLARLHELEMPYVGAGPAGSEAGPWLVEANGLRVAFLAYARFFNQSGNDCPAGPARQARSCLKASLLDPERAVSDVMAAAQAADAVVVSLHWGDEYQPQPREADVALAHRLVDAGALLILGHHPHVLQPIELYPRADGRTALIAYSLGNFVSNQSRNYVHGITPEKVAATRDGVILRAEFARRDYGRGVIRVELSRADWLPLWTENDTADPARRARGKARPSIQVVSLDRALAAVRAELAALPDPVPQEQEARFVQLRRREDLYLSRRAAVSAILGEDLRAEAPPQAQASLSGASISPADPAQR
jgi:poly-gamma-glutamate synthesis protein (capsule biosynthesis protein)